MDLPRAIAVAAAAVGVFGLGQPAFAGELQGVVQLEGPVPKPAVLTDLPASGAHSLEGCGHLPRYSQQLLVSPTGGVQNAVVWLETAGPATGEGEGVTAVLDQQACVFDPHVLIVPRGGMLAIRNSDPVLHNVRIFREATMLMHEWQKPKAEDLTWRFETPGRYLVRCGVHSWMYAWVVVPESRYCAITSPAGAFTFSAVPSGTYTLRVWHETLGEERQSVTVRGGRSLVTIQFTNQRRTTWWFPSSWLSRRA